MSLTRDDLADIKQLMEAVVSAATREQREYLDRRLGEQDDKLDAILDSVGSEFTEHDKQLDDHEVRIVRLEKRIA